MAFLPPQLRSHRPHNGLGRATRVFTRVLATTLAIVLLSCIYYHVTESVTLPHPKLRGRGVWEQDEECHLVHHVANKCDFVRTNCNDEEPGYIPYLQFYYCHLPHAKPVAFVVIVLWLSLLFGTIGLAASDFFCVNLSSIATMAGMSENFAGVTLLALGNGSPDVFSTFAAMYNNSGSLAIGELIGAAGFITAVVAGSMAFIRPFKVPKKTFLRDVVFFIFAASFTLGFLADGKLYLWECVVMVMMYVMYVCFVVAWHWYFRRLKRRRQTESAARSQFNFPGTEAADLGDEYQDEDEDRDPRDRNRSRTGTEDFSALERGGVDGEFEDQEDFPERYLGQINSQMRLRRPRQRDRRNTHDPIRPSLFGAIEFRSVLTGLHREGNLQVYQLNPRRYSDDPTLALSHDQRSTLSEPRNGNDYEDTPVSKRPVTHRTASGNRTRAVSAVEPGSYVQRESLVVPRIDLLGPLDDDATVEPERLNQSESRTDFYPPPSPTISLSPPPSEHTIEGRPNMNTRSHSPERLALPGTNAKRSSTTTSPKAKPRISTTDISVKNQVAESSQYPFPAYTDETGASSSATSPLRHTPTLAPEMQPRDMEEETPRPISWWPYQVLPPPMSILSTLFPTLCTWRDKNLLEKLLAVFSAPSVLLLTMTLPVVEIENENDSDDTIPDLTLPPTAVSSQVLSGSRSEQRGSARSYSQSLLSHPLHPSIGVHGVSGTLGVSDDNGLVSSPEELPVLDRVPEQDDWNRWLVMLQILTAPFFCVLIAWANVDYGNLTLLFYASMGSISFSLIALLFIALTTTPDRTPAWQGMLCVLGFCVSIAWISTIAGEVVGVLKALGVIFNISDAILGLTVFAVGNSLGDLVADITVAKLGYSVMALSACFGGPMLNILLGIGLSGAYMTVKGAQQRKHKHPEKRFKFKPYVVEVDRTLMISGIALLVTLVGLLIVVPLRRWKMDRVVGWWLIGLWVAATLGNLGTEMLMGNGKLH